MKLSKLSDNPWVRIFGGWVSKGWKAFNRWRKRYWLTRTIILLVIFYPCIVDVVVRPPTMVRLVRIACDAILAGGEPQVTHQLTQYYKAREIHNLQSLARAEIDTDGNQKLDAAEQEAALALGVNPTVIEARTVDVDLNEIVATASKLDIAIRTPSARTIRREAFFKALGETELMFAGHHEKIDSLLRSADSFPDRWKLSGWRQSSSEFFYMLFDRLIRFSAILLVWLPWLFVFFLFTLSAQNLLRISSERVGALVALVPALISLGAFLNSALVVTHNLPFGSTWTDVLNSREVLAYYVPYGIPFASVSCITGCWAIRFGKKTGLDYRIGLLLALVIAFVLAVVRLSPVQARWGFWPPTRARLFGWHGFIGTALIQWALLCVFAGLGFAVTYFLSRIRLGGGSRKTPPNKSVQRTR